jgi:hypothetical protein
MAFHPHFLCPLTVYIIASEIMSSGWLKTSELLIIYIQSPYGLLLSHVIWLPVPLGPSFLWPLIQFTAQDSLLVWEPVKLAWWPLHLLFLLSIVPPPPLPSISLFLGCSVNQTHTHVLALRFSLQACPLLVYLYFLSPLPFCTTSSVKVGVYCTHYDVSILRTVPDTYQVLYLYGNKKLPSLRN